MVGGVVVAVAWRREGRRSHSRRSAAATDTGSPVYDRRSASAERTFIICVCFMRECVCAFMCRCEVCARILCVATSWCEPCELFGMHWLLNATQLATGNNFSSCFPSFSVSHWNKSCFELTSGWWMNRHISSYNRWSWGCLLRRSWWVVAAPWLRHLKRNGSNITCKVS